MSEKKWYATKSEMAHPESDEVWTVGPYANGTSWETDSGCDGYGMTKEAADRAVACYNACLGIEDPAAALKAAREALIELLGPGLCTHCETHPAADEARAALKLLGVRRTP